MSRGKEKKISIIVPVFNTEKYLDQCLTSILSQSEDFDEILLINDGSTDSSRKICEKYRMQYPNIRLLDQNNQGQAAARNRGLERATGDYVIFIDSDDHVDSQMCHTIKRYLHTYMLDLLIYNASMQYDIPAAEKAMTHSEELDDRRMTGKEYLYQAFPESYSSSACLAAYRTDFLREYEIRFPEGIYFEDNLFTLKAVLEAQNICCIPDRLYIRRCRAGSTMTGEVSKKKCSDMILAQRSMWEYLKEKRIDAENTEFTNRFVFAGMLYAIGYLKQAVDKTDKNVQIKKLVYTFFEMWIPLFSVKGRSFDQVAAVLLVLKEIEGWSREEQVRFINGFWGSEEKYLEMFRKFKGQLEQEITDRIRVLPFQKENCRVGIYGIGRHTEAVLSLYQRLLGEIRCELYFIVTEKNGGRFYDCPILEASECRGYVDEIVISSRLYQRDMQENLMQQGIEKEKMIVLYQQGDVFDLTAIDRFLTGTADDL